MKPLFTSAYRLQFGAQFTFNDAIKILPYLKKLGIEAIYASPFMKVIKNSFNQYLITSPSQLHDPIGTEEEFFALIDKIYDLHMYFIMDIVPNHLAAHEENLYFSHVLKNGEKSQYAPFFDIDFHSLLFPELKGKIAFPILPKPLKECISEGAIEVIREGGHAYLKVYERTLPLKESKKTALEDILKEQHYHLCSFTEGYFKTNYRKFFDIHEMIGIHIENEDLYKLCHHFPFKLSALDKIAGIRVDHPDGIKDPKAYFSMLSKHFPSLNIWAEKILTNEEPILEDWAVEGSVGYEYLNVLNQLFVNQKEKNRLMQFYSSFIHKIIDVEEEIVKCKKLAIKKLIYSEVQILIQKLFDTLALNGSKLTFSYRSFKEHFVDFLACLDVYRTYLSKNQTTLSPYYQSIVLHAIEKVKKYRVKFSEEALDIIKGFFFHPDVLQLEFVMRLQQIMACVFAKGYEDTFLYRYFALTSLNEVGSDLKQFGIDVKDFHKMNLHLSRSFPKNMLCTTTHDTKRSEDVRFRISALTHDVATWIDFIEKSEKIAQRYLKKIQKIFYPSPNIRYLLYQTLVGFWEEGDVKTLIERLERYMIKAMREGKEESSWIEPQIEKEEILKQFIRSLLEDKEFLKLFLPFNQILLEKGNKLSLSAINLKMGSPGIVAIYQGQESFQYHLVDPDNRGKIDFFALEKIKDNPKKHLISLALRARGEHPELYILGKYIPLYPKEDSENRWVSFMRSYESQKMIVISALTPDAKAGDKAYLEFEEDFEGVNLYSDQLIQTKERKLFLHEIAKEGYAMILFLQES